MTDLIPLSATEDVEVDGAQIALAFHVPVPFFMAEMRRGNVRGTVERGVGEDAGRHRLIFRYRGRKLVILRQPDGRLVTEAPNDPTSAPDMRGS